MRVRALSRPPIAHAARVALVVALVIGVLFFLFALIFDLLDHDHLVAQVDNGLAERLSEVSHPGGLRLGVGHVDYGQDVDAAPIVLWRVDHDGRAVRWSDAGPQLAPSAWSRSGEPTTATLGTSSFRLLAVRSGNGWWVAGQSLAATNHIGSVLLTAELIAGPILVVAVFFGALVIGLKASGPIEQARRRQLEFTADASHELRTPLSVIQAEANLALRTRRDAGTYRTTIERIQAESERLRRIVNDLLWLARFDSEPPPPGDEPVDLVTIATACADRFSAVARSKNIELTVRHEGKGHPLIKAPPEWIDRLIGVLVDNACRYAGTGGAVRVLVAMRGNRVSLCVEDTGPGIPESERAHLFDRFHRATTEGTGAGLGLAIADAVVRSTGGRWRVADAPGGGAHMEVLWHRSPTKDLGHSDPSAGAA